MGLLIYLDWNIGMKFTGCVSKTSEPPTQAGFLDTIGTLKHYALLPLALQKSQEVAQ